MPLLSPWSIASQFLSHCSTTSKRAVVASPSPALGVGWSSMSPKKWIKRTTSTTDFDLEGAPHEVSDDEPPTRFGSSARHSRQNSRWWARQEERQERVNRGWNLDQVGDLGPNFYGDPRLNRLFARVVLLEREAQWWREWWSRNERLWRGLEILTGWFRNIRKALRDSGDEVLHGYDTGTPTEVDNEEDEEWPGAPWS